jgi:hypothetical protein
MEAHPPKLIEDILGALIPPACREHVLGDWHEEYTTTGQYIKTALVTLPFVITSQIRRSFRIELFIAQLCAVYIAFAGASLTQGAGYLYEQMVLGPLYGVIAVVLLVLILCDAYTNPSLETPPNLHFDVALALTFAYFVQGTMGLIASDLMLPPWLMLAGTAFSFPMLIVVRKWYRTIHHPAASAARAGKSLEELQRKAEEEYRKAWHVNFAWLMAACLVLASNWNPLPRSSAAFLVIVLLAVAGVFARFGAYKRGNGGRTHPSASSSISSPDDPYRLKLLGRRNGLQSWSGAGKRFDLGGPALFLVFLIAFPFFLLLLGWMARQPLPPAINTPHWWLSLAALLALSVSWVLVRKVNARAARAIEREFEARDTSEKKD